MLKKIKGLVHWFVALEPIEHKHWYTLTGATKDEYGYNSGRCDHQIGCWYCSGWFCGNIERKDCVECTERKRVNGDVHWQMTNGRLIR